MSQEDVLRLVASVRDEASGPLRRVRDSLNAVKDGAAGPREAQRHLKGMHEEATRGAIQLKTQYRELREHLDKVTSRITEGVAPAFASLAGVAGGGAVATLAAAIRNFAGRGADLDAFSKKVRLTVDTVRGLEGAAPKFHVDTDDLRQNEQALIDQMYRIRKHRGEFYSYLMQQRPDFARALSLTPDDVAGNEQALRLWLQELDKIKRQYGEATARTFSKEALGSDAFVDMLNNGMGGLNQAIEGYNRAAGSFDASKGKAFFDALSDFRNAVEGLQNASADTLLPEITKGVQAFSRAIEHYGPDAAKGITDAFHGVESVVKEVWPQLKQAFDELDPYVQKVGGWTTVFEGFAAIRLTAFAASLTGLTGAVGGLGQAMNLIPLATLVALAKLASDRNMLAAPQGTGARDILKFLDPGLADRLMPDGKGAPAGPGSSDRHEQFQRDRQSINPLFHHSSFGGDGLISSHSEFEEAIARGTASGVLKGLQDFEGLKSMDTGGGAGGLIKASYESGSSGGGGGFDPSPFKFSKRGKAEAGEHADFIRRAAAALGIDPNYALKVAASEGLYASHAGGDKGTSFGDFQMHYGGSGIRGMNAGGLGDLFNKATGLDGKDPMNWRALDLFALMQARKGGWSPWHGAARVGIHGFDGIDRSAPLPAPGALGSRLGSAGQGGGPGALHATGELHVKVEAPRGTKVAATGGGLFKKVNLNRGYSMTEASEAA